MNNETFLWYDFETFGADPRRDRPAQVALMRTSQELEVIGQPETFYCQPANDVLPHPGACLITGITPQLARERGLPENEFAERLFEQMSVPGTCTVGYNSFRFDDEVTRFLFWRNFFDPYSREYANGNSRFDLIDLLRMTRALRPDGLEWPDYEDGRPSFRLEDLAAANGMDTSNAHDALADVEATVAIARLVRTHQPRLWDWALGLRRKHVVADLLEQRKPLVHASARYPAEPGCNVAPVLPLGPHPHISSQWLVWNLNIDPTPFLDLDEELLADLYWTPTADLPPDLERLPVKLVRTNRCPMLSPIGVLDSESAGRLQIDPGKLQVHARLLQGQPEFVARLASLFAQPRDFAELDPELDLYGGFAPPGDQRMYPRIRSMSGDDLARLDTPFTDDRLNELLFRYRARLWPNSLSGDELERWDDFRRRRLLDDPELGSIRWSEYRQLLDEMASEHPDRTDLWTNLAAWPDQLGLSTLAGTENQ
jgi:exodeoxyribonuclease I